MEAGGKWTAAADTPLGAVGPSFGASVSAGIGNNAAACSVTADNATYPEEDDGFHTEQRTESRRHEESREVRELDNRTTEFRRTDEIEFRLEEVKVREFEPRPVTLDEMRALLNAEFDGDVEEVEIGRELTVDEFTVVERKHTTTDPLTGEKKTEVTTNESHTIEETTQKPKWNPMSTDELGHKEDATTPLSQEPLCSSTTEPVSEALISVELEASLPVSSAPAIEVGPQSSDLYTYLTSQALLSSDDPMISLRTKTPDGAQKSGGGGIFGKLKHNKQVKPTSTGDPKSGGIDIDSDVAIGNPEVAVNYFDVSCSSSPEKGKSNLGSSGIAVSDVHGSMPENEQGIPEIVHKHHEVKHKKHVIEEVVLEDTDTFYEEKAPHKKHRLIGKKKKTDKKACDKPEEKRRRSVGELEIQPVAEATTATVFRPLSTSDVSTQQQVTFVVNHDLPKNESKKKSSKDRWSWTLPTFKVAAKDTDSPTTSKTSTLKENKPKTIHGRQEEIVVEDTGLFTDATTENKKWGLRLKKPDLSVSADENVRVPAAEFVTFIVQPNTDIDSELHVEGPVVRVSGDTDTGAQGELELPELDAKVMYAVEPFDVPPAVELEASIVGDGEGEMQLTEPKLKGADTTVTVKADKKWLPDFHFGKKPKQVDITQTTKFVVEQPTSLNTPPDAENPQGNETSAHSGGGIHFPKLNFPSLHFGGKSSGDKHGADVEYTERVNYVVESPNHVADEKPDEDVKNELKLSGHGGFEFPKLKLKSKSSSKDTKENATGTFETITYVVEGPGITNDSELTTADLSAGDTVDISVDTPTLKITDKTESSAEANEINKTIKSDRKWFHGINFGGHHRQHEKVETEEDEIVVVEQSQPDVDQKEVINLEIPEISSRQGPELHVEADLHDGKNDKTDVVKTDKKWSTGFHFGKKPKQVNDESPQTVTFVVEQPDGAGAACTTSGTDNPEGNKVSAHADAGIHFPKLNFPSLHFGGKSSADKHGEDLAIVETVNYVVESSSDDTDKKPDNDATNEIKVRSHGGFEFPKFKLKSKNSFKDAKEDDTGTCETVTFVVEGSGETKNNKPATTELKEGGAVDASVDVPKDRWSWNLPTFKLHGKDTDSTASSETSTLKEKKPKTIHGRQEEIVVEDTGLFTDATTENKKWGLRMKKPHVSVSASGDAQADARVPSETVTFIVQPNTDIDSELHVEGPGVKVSGDTDTRAQGELELPELDAKVKYDVDNFDIQPAVELEVSTDKDDQSEIKLSEPSLNGVDKTVTVKSDKKWLPDFHFGKKPKQVEITQTTTFVVEQPTSPNNPSDAENPESNEISAHNHGEIHFPKLNFPSLHYGGKSSADKHGSDPEHIETVNYVVESPSDDADKNPGDDATNEIKVDGHGGFEFPKFKLNSKSSFKDTKEDDTGTCETVTFVVEGSELKKNNKPATTELKEGGAVDASVGVPKDRWSWNLPTFKLHGKDTDSTATSETSTLKEKKPKTIHGRQEEIVVEDTGLFTDVTTENPESIETSAHAHGGIHFPKLNFPSLHLGGKSSADKHGSDPEHIETVNYVVESSSDDADKKPGDDVTNGTKVCGHGGFEFHKFKLRSKNSFKDAKEDDTGTCETVTFVVEGSGVTKNNELATTELKEGGAVDASVDVPKDRCSWNLPTFKLHGKDTDSTATSETSTLKEKKPKTIHGRQEEIVVEDTGLFTDVTTENPESIETSAHTHGGIHFPKINFPSLHFGGKSSAEKQDADGESPSNDADKKPGDDESNELKVSGHGGFEFPKLKLKSKKSFKDAKEDVPGTNETVTYVVEEPGVTQTIDVEADVSAENHETDAGKLPELKLADGTEDERRTKIKNRSWLSGASFKEANVDTGETVTYIIDHPDMHVQPRLEDSGERQFEVKPLDISVEKNNEGENKIVSPGNEQILSLKLTAGIEGNDGIAVPEQQAEGKKKDKRKTEKQNEKTIAEDGSVMIVEDSQKKKWGINFGKKSEAAANLDLSEKPAAQKSSNGKKWKAPKLHFRSKASYDVSVAPAEAQTTSQRIEASLIPNSATINIVQLEVNGAQSPDGATETEDFRVEVSGTTPEVHVDKDAQVQIDDIEITPAKISTDLFSEPPMPATTIDVVSVSTSSSGHHDTVTRSSQLVVNGFTDDIKHQSAVDRREEFIFTGGLDNDDRIRVSSSFTTSTPKKTTSLTVDQAPTMRSDAADVIVKEEEQPTSSEPVSWLTPHLVIVAIDFGTTFSGYAFCFPGDVTAARERGESLPAIHVMRKWEDGDPGAIDMKTPTTLLLTPEGEFHSFGFTARNFYHDLSPTEACRWLYFEKFKMALHYCAELNTETELQAANGVHVKAFVVFSAALRYFRNHALQELSEQSQTRILNEDVRWIITVPAIWKEPAKQFMREAAYEAGIASIDNPSQLFIALEPEAASIFVRRQRLQQLIPREEELSLASRRATTPEPIVVEHTLSSSRVDINASLWSPTLQTSFQPHRSVSPILSSSLPEIDMAGTKYMIVDCGGGTVDITVYEMVTESGKLRELHQATGGPFGSIGVDKDFEGLLVEIFGSDFIEAFKRKRPAGWVDLLLAFESRKRAATPFKSKPLNVSLPFSFTDYHKKYRNCTVEVAVRRFNSKDVTWSQQGMLRLSPDAMHRLFQGTISRITEQIANVFNEVAVRGLRYIFLVGGFSESPMLQFEIRNAFAESAKILIPNDASLTILKGAVCYGLEPGIVASRKSRLTYGVAVVKRFQRGRDPESKLAVRDGVDWCTDVFDVLVRAGDSVGLDDPVVRSYAPVVSGQKSSVFTVYATETPDVRFVTDANVRRCGTLKLELEHQSEEESGSERALPREIRTKMIFGDTEIKVVAIDVASGRSVRAQFDFLLS